MRDASDDEFLRALQRAERTELPSSAKMQELADRLGPMMTAKSSAAVHPWRWIGVAAMTGFVVVGALSVRRQLDVRDDVPAAAPRVVEVAAPAPAPAPVLPRDELHDNTAPVVSVDSLPSVSAPTVPPAAHTVNTESACDGELELVERSDAKLRAGDAQGALALARQHAARCARGEFVQERERIAIEALAQLGRTSEVRARARAFERQFPTSPHLWRIRSLAERDSE
ncbi:hypothetical protein AKJ09_05438 [Labilithrix luteola]|uniref:Uncharacterized protein n=1 Tax=Labilithrix luteola TaxID=1391654 RepID=A0A0K1Q058_9BACT|nr:hypothetical protein AKJ09_05438 [Labilithrix luteola]